MTTNIVILPVVLKKSVKSTILMLQVQLVINMYYRHQKSLFGRVKPVVTQICMDCIYLFRQKRLVNER